MLSTIPYLFGKFLHRKLGAPVDIINAASGGAFGNDWCSWEQLTQIEQANVQRMIREETAAILDEMSAGFYRNDKLRVLDHTDWTLRRCDEARLGSARNVPDQMGRVLGDERVQESIKRLRKAVEQYRAAVEQLGAEPAAKP